MSDKAKKLIERAIKLYVKEDGASEEGAYRDAVTDVHHIYVKNVLKGKYKDCSLLEIAEDGRLCFLEEEETKELDRLNAIPDKQLTGHSADEFQFDTCKDIFEERLEYYKIKTMAYKKLPLLVGHKFLKPETKDLFERRLKEEKSA